MRIGANFGKTKKNKIANLCLSIEKQTTKEKLIDSHGIYVENKRYAKAN